MEKRIFIAFFLLFFYFSSFAIEDADCTDLSQLSGVDRLLCTNSELNTRYEHWLADSKILQDQRASELVSSSRAKRLLCEDINCLVKIFDEWEANDAVMQMHATLATNVRSETADRPFETASAPAITTSNNTQETPKTEEIQLPAETNNNDFFRKNKLYISISASLLWIILLFIQGFISYTYVSIGFLYIVHLCQEFFKIEFSNPLAAYGGCFFGIIILKYICHRISDYQKEQLRQKLNTEERALREAERRERIYDYVENVRDILLRDVENQSKKIIEVKGKEFAKNFHQYRERIINTFLDANKDALKPLGAIASEVFIDFIENSEFLDQETFDENDYNCLEKMEEILSRLDSKEIMQGDREAYVSYMFGRPDAIDTKNTAKSVTETWKYDDSARKNSFKKKITIKNGVVVEYDIRD